MQILVFFDLDPSANMYYLQMQHAVVFLPVHMVEEQLVLDGMFLSQDCKYLYPLVGGAVKHL
jgi:hypothetical protein